jgi:hypothetical protein
MENNLSSNLSNIETTLCNPFYLSLVLYIVLLFIIIYSFDHSHNIQLSHHIKFFIYSYLFLVIYNLYINDVLVRKTKQEFKLSPTHESFNEIMK